MRTCIQQNQPEQDSDGIYLDINSLLWLELLKTCQAWYQQFINKNTRSRVFYSGAIWSKVCVESIADIWSKRGHCKTSKIYYHTTWFLDTHNS